MKTNTKLSIIIPTYNRIESLKKTISSIINQLNPDDDDTELIITDNDSTDGTREYLTQLRHNSIKVNLNAANLGIFPNVEKGLAIANGEYAWVVGSDDLIVESMLEKARNLILENRPDLAFFNNCYYFPSSQKVNESGFVEKDKFSRRIISDRETGLYKTKELIDLRIDAFTSIYSFVLKRNDWLQAVQLHSKELKLFDSAENCIPHAIYIARNLASKTCLYIADPIVLASHEVGWSRYFPLYFMQYLPDLYAEWEMHGVANELIKQCKQALFTETDHVSCVNALLADNEIKSRFKKFLYIKRFYKVKGSFSVVKKIVFPN